MTWLCAPSLLCTLGFCWLAFRARRKFLREDRERDTGEP